MQATTQNVTTLFNGKDLAGWSGDKEVWSVENGEIVGKTAKGLKRNNFLKSTMEVADFRLSLKVKLVPNRENSGIQFRSEALPDGDVKGPQADVGLGWWGKLYEEHGRGLLITGEPGVGEDAVLQEALAPAHRQRRRVDRQLRRRPVTTQEHQAAQRALATTDDRDLRTALGGHARQEVSALAVAVEHPRRGLGIVREMAVDARTG